MNSDCAEVSWVVVAECYSHFKRKARPFLTGLRVLADQGKSASINSRPYGTMARCRTKAQSRV